LLYTADMEGPQSRFEKKLGSEGWTPRQEIPMDKEYFRFQFEVADAMADRLQISLAKSVDRYAPFIFRNAFVYDKDEKMYVKREGVTPETILDVAYDVYLKKVSTDPVEYRDGHRFGCSSISYNPEEKTAWVHFMNAEYDSSGPLTSSKLEQRRSEIADALRLLKEEYPDVPTINGHSWLYNLEAYRRLYPKTYTETLRADANERNWTEGTRLWGQFLDSDGKLRTDLAEIFMERLVRLPPDRPLSEIMTPPLMLPMFASAPAEVFYEEYGIR